MSSMESKCDCVQAWRAGFDLEYRPSMDAMSFMPITCKQLCLSCAPTNQDARV
jgi:hypothetical protein